MNLLITPDKMLHVDGKVYKVQIGANGFIDGDLKREGDMATPCGIILYVKSIIVAIRFSFQP